MMEIIKCSECENTPKILLKHEKENDKILSICKNSNKNETTNIEDFLDKNIKDFESSIKCKICGIKSSQTKNNFKFCKSCQIFICTEEKDICSSLHREEDNCPLKDYILILSKNLKNFCSEHYKICQDYCISCRKKICQNCIENHKEHEIKKIKDMQVNENYLEELINKYNIQKEKLKLLLEIIPKVYEQINDYLESLKAKIEIFYNINEKELDLTEKIIKNYKANVE